MIINTRQFGLVEVVESQYHTHQNRVALILRDYDSGGRVATLTVNIPEVDLEPGEFFVKTWAENEQIAVDCLASGFFVDTGKRVPTGWVEAQVWRLLEETAQETRCCATEEDGDD